MRTEHRDGVEDECARIDRALALLRFDPRCGKAVDRLALDAGAQTREHGFVGDRQQSLEFEPAGSGEAIAHADAVAARIPREVVAQSDPGKNDADVGGQRAPDFTDPVEQRVGERLREKLCEIRADLD